MPFKILIINCIEGKTDYSIKTDKSVALIGKNKTYM